MENKLDSRKNIMKIHIFVFIPDWNELFTTKCIACGFPIEAGDRWVEALNSNYHSQCFNCTVRQEIGCYISICNAHLAQFEIKKHMRVAVKNILHILFSSAKKTWRARAFMSRVERSFVKVMPMLVAEVLGS